MLKKTQAEKKSKIVQRAQELGRAAPGFFLGSLYGGTSPSAIFQFRWGEIARQVAHDIKWIRDAAAEIEATDPDRSRVLAVRAEDVKCVLERAQTLVDITVISELESLDCELGGALEIMMEIAREKESRSQTAPASPQKVTQ